MTTTTRTTRKAPWAAALTALLAVIALVFGALAFAGVANAKDDNPNKPDNPGNSQNAPGHENTPPGQDPGETPGSSHDKMTICHYVEGKGETKAGYNIITMNEQAWAAHLAHHPDTLDVVYNGVSCPTTPTVTSMSVCSAPPGAAAATYSEVVFGPATGYQTDEAVLAAYNAAIAAGQRAWTGDPAACTNAAPRYFCPNSQTELSHPYNASDPADVAACTPPVTTYACPDTTAKAGTAMTHLFDPTVPEDVAFCGITADQAAGIDAAMAATAPEAVAPVEAATVTEEPETVAVPAPATVATPAAVPAGDGSTVPQVPVALLALLALATAAAVTSGLRLATNR